MTLKHEIKLKKVLTVAYQEYEKNLKKYALFKVSDPELSIDLVQNTFMKTWKYLMRGGKIDTMKSFLYHILNDLIIDHYRKHKTTSLDVLQEKGFEPNIDDRKRLFDTIDGKKAFLLIKKIPSKYQEIVHMRYVQDMSLEEISTITGVSRNNIAVTVHRGLIKLKSLYSQNNKKPA